MIKNRVACLISVFLISGCFTIDPKPFDYTDGTVISEWNHVLTKSIIQDLFTPPVSSRIDAYPNLAAYEILKYESPNAKSITANLIGFDSIPPPPSGKINLTISALTAFTTVGAQLVYSENILKDYYRSTIDSMAKSGISEKIMEQSVAYGNRVAEIILKRASTDMFKKTRSMTRYVLKNAPGSWEPTPPDYMQGVEPNWKLLHTFVLDSCSMFSPDSILPFSTEKNSIFSNAALEVRNVGLALDSEQVSIIKFWDDNPNVSSHFGHATFFSQKMTPGGHWMAITGDVVRKKELTQSQAAFTFSLTAVALYDAFIACWDAKYSFSTIRPVTYIQKYIDKDWSPYLQTPPFPEFPSGHSTVSAAAATVLTGLFGENYTFTDSSEVPFGLPIRSFDSFYDASNEAAMSRLYGGIHFHWGNEAGKILGKKVGKMVLDKAGQGGQLSYDENK